MTRRLHERPLIIIHLSGAAASMMFAHNQESSIRLSPELWRERIEGISRDRCDLDILLREEWRHRVALRDDGSGPGGSDRQLLAIEGSEYADLRQLLDRIPLSALALTVWHSVLAAYGHGSRTVVAFLDGLDDPPARLLPVIVDHAVQADLTGLDAIERLVGALSRKQDYSDPAALARLGLFDAALLVTDRELDPAELPRFPLVSVVRDERPAGRLHWSLYYAGELFDAAVIGGLLQVARAVLGQLASHPGRLVRDIELVSGEQKLQLARHNDTSGEFPDGVRLEQLVEESVRRSPDQDAVVIGERRLSYRRLDERANRFAHWLIGTAVGVGPGEVVALCLDKSECGTIAALGIWKAGAAYVHLDANYPADYIGNILDDTAPAAVLANDRHLARLRGLFDQQGRSVALFSVERILGQGGEASTQPTDKPALAADSTGLAYVSYTSGTTGVPKGVPKEHTSVVNSITDLSERYEMRVPGQERVALYASYVFEPHLRQTLIALINSQTVVIVPDDIRLDPEAFPDYLARHRVTYLNATGSVLQHFDLRRCASLKKLLLVGEELTASGLRRLRETFTGLIINEYAFTEAAFVTAIKAFPPGQVGRTDRSIGRPLRNVTWYVLSQSRKQLPVGAIGELYIGGCGVARGYLKRPELTARCFFANPFRSEHDRAHERNARIYRTGDLARMLPNGEVEYLGRGDFQLKLNGVRVEPGEIETRAMEFPGVRKCVVVARESGSDTGDRYLVGYYTTEERTEVSEADLLGFLEQRLIRVMVPARMLWLPGIPVNINGKVDLRALPPVEFIEPTPIANTPTDVPPDDAVLAAVREIWSDVLGVGAERIDTCDDFFLLGGQSISCILLIVRIRQQLRLTVGVDEVFRLRTLDRLVEFLRRKQGQTSPAEPDADVMPDGDGSRMLASGLQQGLLYRSLKNADGEITDDVYVMQTVYRYHSAIAPELMEQAWRSAQRKYPGLRLRFEPGADPIQVVGDPDTPLAWTYVDLADMRDPDQQQARIRQLQMDDRVDPYRLVASRLFRVYLVKQRDELFTLIFSCHHVIMDGWSLSVLHDEVHRAYLRLAEGRPVDETEDQAYCAAQRYWAAHRNDHVEYWTRQVERIEERGDLTGLLNSRSRYKVVWDRHDRVLEHRARAISLDIGQTAALTAICTGHQVTVHSVLQFVWHKVLHAIGGAPITVVGTIVSGRNMPVDGIEFSVGLFINTLPLIVDHDRQAAQDVAGAVADIQAAVNVMNSRSTVELGRLGGGGMKRRLFDTLLVLENYPRLLDENENRRHHELLRFEKDYDIDKVDYPIAVVAREEDGELTINLWYAGELFDEDAIDTLLATVRTLLDQVIADMNRPVAELEYVSPAMVERFDAWNDTEADFPEDRTLHGVFEEMVSHYPDQPALIYRDLRLSYRELNERSNRLAHYLRSRATLDPDDLVALVMDKSELMVVAILAVWKTGSAYVPIDPSYPDDRIAFMLRDTRSRLVLTQQRYGERLRGLVADESRQVLELEGLALADQPTANPDAPCKSSNLAYAIHTSGTTGRPKAVLVEHIGVVNLHTSLSRLFRLSKDQSDESFLSFSNFVFDHFVEQMTDALLNGQKLVVLDDSMRTDVARLRRYINDHRVTYLSGTPSVLSLYDFSGIGSLTRIDAIGEDLTEPVFDKIRRGHPGVVINGYGPTEVSITSHKRPYQPGERRSNKSIGFPVANYTAYVLDKRLKRVPIGGVGELYIGGVGVSRGYLNQPELTRERFLDNPFQIAEERRRGRNARIYKTGDLARWLPNGEIECLGRTDFQIKIRGLRVEPGEIESVLSSYPGITRALVIAREHEAATEAVGSARYLVGFYISDRDLDEHDIKQFMRTRLSDALVPARLLRIDDIPVTASGKLDPTRLPATEFVGCGEMPYVPPMDDVEIRLCGIWSSLLGIAPNRIGARDDFFALGGDSLRAMALAQAITSGFACNIGIAAVFRYTTLADLATHVRDKLAVDPAGRAGPVVGLAGAWTDGIPLSPAQERLLFIDAFEGGTDAYNVPFVLRIGTAGRPTGAVEAVVADGLHTMVRRHAALRTLLRTDGCGVHRQLVLTENEALARFALFSRSAVDRTELDRMLLDEARYVSRLGEELPVRAWLHTRADRTDAVYLSMVVHHVCFDGRSREIFRCELSALVNGASESDLPVVTGSYADFAVWQRRYLSAEQRAELAEYWNRKLSGFETVRLPSDFARPARFDYRGREIGFDVDETSVEQLRALARTARVSLFSVLLGAWYLMLRVYTGQEDLVVGTPMANRARPEFDGVIGLFVNTIVIRMRVDPKASLIEYLGAVGAEVLAAQVHGELPFEQLVKELGVPADASRQALVQISFTLENGPAAAEPVSKPTGYILHDYLPHGDGRTRVKFDVSLMLRQVPDGMTGTLTYAESIFDATTAASFLGTFRHLLAEFCRLSAAAGTARLSDVTWTGRHRWPAKVDAPVEPAARRSLHDVFEAVVERWPDEVAVVCGEVRLSYYELNERANQLAHLLRSTVRPRPDDLVALVLDRSEWTVVAILATWKAGAAYLPIDPSYPDERIGFMFEDSRARGVLANEAYGSRLRRLLGRDADRVLVVERQDLSGQPSDNPALDVAGSDLAYAIYTSGTTGQPKAVMVEHRNVLGFQAELRERYFGPASEQRQGVLLLSSYVFDFSVEQLVLAILGGHKLIVSSSLPDEQFYRLANREGLTYLSGTPTQLQQFDLSRLEHLQAVLVAGEVFRSHHFDKLRREFAGPIYNAYGTTETTVYNTVQAFPPGTGYQDSLGRSLGNTRLHVLDSELRPLPPGAAGELYLAGDCVSRGYLNRRELDRERFLANPFQTDAERREGRYAVLYRTGDRVRHRPDGSLQYLGRNDAQIKLHGLRIEPGEIEAALAASPGVRQCAVLVRADESRTEVQRLIGYYVPEGDTRVSEEQLLVSLRARLIPAMVPSRLIPIEGHLPMTINGKLDESALPGADFVGQRESGSVPRNRLEARLCALWGAQLPGGTVGIDDDFFRCGGDSIGALHLASRVQDEIGRSLSVRHIFDFPTVRRFAEHLQAGTSFDDLSKDRERAEQGRLTGPCPTLPVQEWFFAKSLSNRNRWNQNFAIRTPALDIDTLRNALAELVDYHDAFRLRYRQTESGTVEQRYDDADPAVTLHVLNVRQRSEADVRRQLLLWQDGFDLDRGPIACAAYLDGFPDGSARIWFAMHHLVVDVVSWRIIARDLEILYHGGDLGAKSGSYRQWAQAIRGYVPAPGEVRLWADLAAELSASGDPIADAAKAPPRRTRFELDRSRTRALLTTSNRAFETDITDLLLTATGIALRSITGRDRNHVTIEGHGRGPLERAPEVRDTVGWFTTMYPLAIESGPDLGRAIQATRASRRRVPRHGIGYGALRGRYGSAEAPLPSVSVNYLGRFADGMGPDGVEPSGSCLNAAGIPAGWQLDVITWIDDTLVCAESTIDATLDVTMSCVGERLVVVVNSRLDPVVRERFSSGLKTALEQIAAHTGDLADRAGEHSTESKRPFEPYALIEGGNPSRPLFVLPPGEGGAESYLGNIAEQLSGHTLVLFNNLHLHTPCESFETLAARYVKLVRRLQPLGPYNLLGWSFGGILALEAASQLARAGERIGNLLVIDAYFNMRRAAAEIGLPDKQDILDPINYRYQPNTADLRRLREHLDSVVLFRATRVNDVVRSDAQRRMFEYYLEREPYNNLDTLLPRDAIQVEPLTGETHHSWVRNRELVHSICQRISNLLAGTTWPGAEANQPVPSQDARIAARSYPTDQVQFAGSGATPRSGE